MDLPASPLPTGPPQISLRAVLVYNRTHELLLCSVLAEKRNVAHLNLWGKVTDCSVPKDAELESMVKREE